MRCATSTRFGHADRGDLRERRERIIEAMSHFASDMPGDMLGGWIETIKGRDSVEVGILEGFDNSFEHVFYGVKVAEQAIGIKVVACDGHGDVPIMAVDLFAYA